MRRKNLQNQRYKVRDPKLIWKEGYFGLSKNQMLATNIRNFLPIFLSSIC